MSKETHLLTKQETLLGRGAGEESESKGNQKDSPAMLVVTGFTVMGLVLGCLWSVILTQGPS